MSRLLTLLAALALSFPAAATPESTTSPATPSFPAAVSSLRERRPFFVNQPLTTSNQPATNRIPTRRQPHIGAPPPYNNSFLA